MDIQKAIDTLSAAANSSASKNWNYTPYVKAVLAHITELQQSAEKAEAQLARYSMSAGEADQRAAESRAVRNALGFCEEADDVAPCDLVDAINLLRAAPPVPVKLPDGWEACTPEWINRNGPCSCANAPRLAFGSVGQHYHPHIFIDNTAPQYEALAASKGCVHEWIPSQGRTASGYLCRKCGDYNGPDAAPKPEDKR